MVGHTGYPDPARWQSEGRDDISRVEEKVSEGSPGGAP